MSKEHETGRQEQNSIIEQLGRQNKALLEENTALKKQIESLKNPNPVRVDGFRLDVNDPFAAGTLRDFIKMGGKNNGQTEALPFVMSWNDRATAKALAKYAVRAKGAGDKARAKIAAEAAAKCEK